MIREAQQPPQQGPIIKVTSPIKGIDKTSAREQQDATEHCWDALNVLPYDLFGRRRAAQRPGLSQFSVLQNSSWVQGLLPIGYILQPGATIGVPSTIPWVDWTTTGVISGNNLNFGAEGTATFSVDLPSSTVVFSYIVTSSTSTAAHSPAGGFCNFAVSDQDNNAQFSQNLVVQGSTVSPGFDPSTYIRWSVNGYSAATAWVYLTGADITISAQMSATMTLQPGSIAGAQNGMVSLSLNGTVYARYSTLFYGQLMNTTFVVDPANLTEISIT
jgi:hypothetical protein